jgi:5'-3' exonuclease
VIRLANLEADFVPYYILTRNLVENNGDTGFVIYSNDHDLWQGLNDNIFIFSKAGKNKKIIKHGKIVNEYLKKENNIPDEYYPLVMSIIGDPGDDVTGVNGVGPKRFIDVFPDILSMVGSMNELYDKVEKGKDIFNIIPDCSSNKHLGNIISSEIKNKTISNNLKLVSFELISRFLENPKTTETLERKNQILQIITEEKKIASPEAMKKALEINNVFIEEASIDFLYL